MTVSQFVEEFQRDHGRHPITQEVWDAARADLGKGFEEWFASHRNSTKFGIRMAYEAGSATERARQQALGPCGKPGHLMANMVLLHHERSGADLQMCSLCDAEAKRLAELGQGFEEWFVWQKTSDEAGPVKVTEEGKWPASIGYAAGAASEKAKVAELGQGFEEWVLARIKSGNRSRITRQEAYTAGAASERQRWEKAFQSLLSACSKMQAAALDNHGGLSLFDEAIMDAESLLRGGE